MQNPIRVCLQWLERRSSNQVLIVLVLLAIALFINTVGNQFVYDDHILIEQNYALRDWDYFTKLFTNSHSYDESWINLGNNASDYYRPFTRLLFGLAFHAFGLQPAYWHLLAVAFFCIVVLLGYAIVKRLTESRAVAAIAILLFVVHPIHSESVAWVNCLVELLHASFFLGAFYLYLLAKTGKRTAGINIIYIGSLTLAISALLSKETALSFPILIMAYELIDSKSPILKRVTTAIYSAAPYLMIIPCYLALRYYVYGGTLRINSYIPFRIVIFSLPRVILEYFKMLVLPIGLSPVHTIPLVINYTELSCWLSLLLLGLGGFFICFYLSRQLIFAFAWILIILMPALNIGSFPLDIIIQDRYAFLPSLGFCLVVAIGLNKLAEVKAISLPLQYLVIASCAAAIIALSVLTVRQNSYWHSDVTLWARGVSQNPESEFANVNYGWAFYYQNQKEDAAKYFTNAFKIKNGRSASGALGLALYYDDKKDYPQAIQFYELSLQLGQGNLNLLVYTQLANAYYKNGDRRAAIEILNKTLEAYPNLTQARELLNNILSPADNFGIAAP